MAKLREILNATIIKVLTLLIVGILATLFGWVEREYLKEKVGEIHTWLNSQHVLTAYGWRFVFLCSLPFLILLSLTILFLFCFKCFSKKYSSKETIITILSKWVLEHEDTLAREELVYFHKVDRENRLKKGSAQRYLPLVIENTDNLTITHIDKNTTVIKSK